MGDDGMNSAILSFGAGVNSTALAILLINGGWKGEIVFSDTGCEWPDTYCFMTYFENEWLRPRGFQIVGLKGMPWHRKGKHLEIMGCSLIEYCEAAHVIPLAAMRWCTSEWKVRPLQRYQDGQTTMLGIAADEAHRQGDAIRPLVEWGIGRQDCVDIIAAEGLPIPRKSGCYICTFQGNTQWRELWERHPKLFDRAMRLEEGTAGSKSARWNTTLDPHGKITLRMRKLSYESQMVLPEIDMDALLAYRPCVCGI